MLMASPINNERLIHSIIYEEYLEDTGEGAGYAPPLLIERVKVDSTHRTVKTNNGWEKVSMAVVFVDYVNSIPAGLPKFKEKSKITFTDADGNVMNGTIDKSDELYGDSNTIHHHELEVI